MKNRRLSSRLPGAATVMLALVVALALLAPRAVVDVEALAPSSSAGSSSSGSSLYETIAAAKVLDPVSREPVSALQQDSSDRRKQKSLVVLLPQLGEFTSSELCEPLAACRDALRDRKIDLRVIGIAGSTAAAREFCQFTGLPPECLRLDPDAALHRSLRLHAGPGWSVPDFVSEDALTFLLNRLPGGAPDDAALLRPAGDAWLNYLAMCAGLGAPGTLGEILRGYFGDFRAPERWADDGAVVKAGLVEIGPGVGPVKIGPFRYTQWWADERGYQRPVELATVRLKNMAEILTKWDTYVSNPLTMAQCGATFLFDEEGKTLYEYRHRGVLTYSETMSRPLQFLAPYIGEELARNPLGLPDLDGAAAGKRGRGILKPAGKFMGLLQPIFSAENRLQAQLLGAQDADLLEAQKKIGALLSEHAIVIFTYGLSPFSWEATALLDSYKVDYHKEEIGSEWFLLGKEGSAMRAALLDQTGQSSLPHVFVGGKHVGGIFSGPKNGGPGLAALQEAGELQDLLQTATAATNGDATATETTTATVA